MDFVCLIAGWVLVAGMAWEAFESIVLPRTVSRKIRFTGLFYYLQSRVSRVVARCLRPLPAVRESFLSAVGPLALVLLMACWAFGIILGFALVHFGLGTTLSNSEGGFLTCLYMSAATFFTLGYGDVVALDSLGRGVSMVEAGMGFGVLALVISYMPVLYQSFSARERVSLLLDARAGSPPVASSLLLFYGGDLKGLEQILGEFEHWGASLLESYLSYPILASYRSQHEQLSWLASLTCVIDASAYVMVGYRDDSSEMESLQRQAKLTYAMLRHLAVDLNYILNIGPHETPGCRLVMDDWRVMAEKLKAAGAPVCLKEGTGAALAELRDKYEPYVYGLSRGLFLLMPGWMPTNGNAASWETSAWDSRTHF